MPAHALVLVVLGVLAAGCGKGRMGGNRSNIDPPKSELELAKRPLTTGEQEKLDEHGFAILGSAAAQSYHVGYTALFHAHQPVFISADSLPSRPTRSATRSAACCTSAPRCRA